MLVLRQIRKQVKNRRVLKMKNVKRTSTTYIATESGKGWSKAKKNITTVEEIVNLVLNKIVIS